MASTRSLLTIDVPNSQRTTLSFTQANLTALRSKVDQFNQEAVRPCACASVIPLTSSRGVQGPAVLSSNDVAGIDSLAAFLGKPIGTPPAEGVSALGSMLRWPEAKQFPGRRISPVSYFATRAEALASRL